MRFRLTLTTEDGVVLDHWMIDASDSDALEEFEIVYPLREGDGNYLQQEINRAIKVELPKTDLSGPWSFRP
jgi:hypothetical protein